MRKLNLYTLVIDYDGGTYICQAEASSKVAAPVACIESWDSSSVLKKETRSSLIEQVASEEFTAISGASNVWCGCANIGSGLAILNLIQTVKNV